MRGMLSRFKPGPPLSSPVLLDLFRATDAAPLVTPRTCEPGPGALTVTDTENKLSIGGGKLLCAGPKAVSAWGDPGVWGPAHTRSAGRAVYFLVNFAAVDSNAMFGYDINTTADPYGNAFRCSATAIQPYDRAVQGPNIGAIAAATNYELMLVERSAGAFYLVKGGAYANWTLLWVDHTDTTGTVYPVVCGRSSIFSVERLQVADLSRAWAYDDGIALARSTFTGANGTTLSALTPERGNKWATAAAWTVSGDKAVTASTQFVGVQTGKSSVIVEAATTRAGGVVGLLIAADHAVTPTNYLIAYHDGTNCKLDRVSGGTATLITGAAAYAAGARLVVIKDGVSYSLFYNNAKIGSTTTYDNALTNGNTIHGLYSTNAGNTLDDFYVWDRNPQVFNANLASTAPNTSAGWTKVFEDLFDTLNPSVWSRAYWWIGNENGCRIGDELEWYQPDDAYAEGGVLKLRAQKRDIVSVGGTTSNYTSGVVTTGGIKPTVAPSFSFTYGYVEARVNIPTGKGLWPAFWMLPVDGLPTVSPGSRPEIDIMEALGDAPAIHRMAYHWDPGDFGANYAGTNLSDGWHVVSVLWDPGLIVWYLDGIERARIYNNVSAEPMYLLLNMAVGGTYAGAPDANTPFPSYFQVDYVRVWQRS